MITVTYNDVTLSIMGEIGWLFENFTYKRAVDWSIESGNALFNPSVEGCDDGRSTEARREGELYRAGRDKLN